MQTHAPKHASQAKTRQGKMVQQSAQMAGELHGKLLDTRPEKAESLQLRQLMTNSHKLAGGRALQAMINNSAQAQNGRTLQAMMNNRSQADKAQAAPNSNNTGLPNQLKAGIESLSGISMDHVKVHYNSSQPAQLNALAYAQGNEIHVAAGQEQHVAHEAWHVVQQVQGRVKPTMQMKGGVAVNDDVRLEAEADVMGARAMELGTVQMGKNGNAGTPTLSPSIIPSTTLQSKQNSNTVYQRLIIPAARVGLAANINTANLAVSEQQVNDLMDKYRIPELKHIQRELTENGVVSGLFEGKTNDERLLSIVNGLLKNGPSLADQNPMGYFDKRTASAAVANEPDIDENLRQAINLWVVGDPQRGIVWGAIGNHLRGKINVSGYRDLGVQCSLLLPPDEEAVIDQLMEPAKTQAYVQLSRNAFTVACNELRGALGQLPDFNGKSYRQSGVASAAVYGSLISTGDIIMDKAFWSTSIFRGAGGAAGTWTDVGTAEHPIAYYIINGTSGKYIAKYARTEGEREVLFSDNTTFQVDRIVNLKNKTFFVYVSEVPHPGIGTPIKNPFNGAVY